MEYIKSERGKDKLVYEGYTYVKQKDLANGVVSFECEGRRNEAACKAKVKVDSRKSTVVGRLKTILMHQMQRKLRLLRLYKR